MAPKQNLVIGEPASDDDFISEDDEFIDDDGKGKKGKGKASDKKRDKGKSKVQEVSLLSGEDPRLPN